MATILGVYISENILGGDWLAQDCNNTAADYWYTNRLLPLNEKCNLIRAAALDSDSMEALDTAESGLWLLKTALDSLRQQAIGYRAWLSTLHENTGSWGGATDESCNQNRSTLLWQKVSAQNIVYGLTAQLTLTVNTIAEIQAIQDDELNEEQIQNALNDAANRINAERLEVDARLQEVRTLEFVNNLQQVLLPLLITSVAVVAFTRKR